MITSKDIDTQGTVHLWDLGPTKVRMPAVDARHAIDTEPERWALVDPKSPDRYVPERSASESGGEGAAVGQIDLSGSTDHVEKTAVVRDASEAGGEGAV